jgi:hypothetical protein
MKTEIKIKNSITGKMLFMIATVLFLMHSLPTTAQHRIDLYYLKNEITSSGNVLSYIPASEIDSSQPKQLIIQRGGPIAILPLHDSLPPIAEMPTLPVTPYPSSDFLYIHAPYLVSEVRIIDRNSDRVIYEQKNVQSRVLTANISELQNGFYTLEIVSIVSENSKGASYE